MGTAASKPKTKSFSFKKLKAKLEAKWDLITRTSTQRTKQSSLQHDGKVAHSDDNLAPAVVDEPATAEVSNCKLGHIAHGNSGAYQGAPMPANESERLHHLCSMNVLDTPRDERFDAITSLACMVFKVPIALVSLVDKERQWFKSVQGLDVSQTDRKSSFCAWTLLPEFPEVLVVQDATQDARFKNNALVTGAPDIRFYAGCPLIASNGMRLGSLCIIDRKPRDFDAESCMMLANLGQMVVRQLEKDVLLAKQKEVASVLSKENSHLLKAIGAFSEGMVLCNVREPSWTVDFMNEAFSQQTGLTKDDMTKGFWNVFKIVDKDPDKARATYEVFIEAQQSFQVTAAFQDASRPKKNISFQLRCANVESMDRGMPLVGIPAILTSPADSDAPIYYFATIKQDSSQLESAQSGFGSAFSPPSTSGHSSGVNTNSAARRLLMPHAHKDPFGDVKLGQLLGRGSYGRVYRGTWNGATVAVKILEYRNPLHIGDASNKHLQNSTSSEHDVVPANMHDINGRAHDHGSAAASDSAGGGGGGPAEESAPEFSHFGSIDVGRGERQHQDGHCKEQLEALLSTQLSHPNVVQTYKHCTREFASGSADAAGMMETWMVMEFCNKGSLLDAIDRGMFRRGDNIFEPEYGAMLRIAKEIASAMSYLHDLRILHGDLTPNNVLLAGSDKDASCVRAKVCDFGLSRVLGEQEDIRTLTFGTVTHMPPELLVDGQLGRPADVYAFGVICWEMFMCQRPWHGLSHGQIIHAMSSGKQLQVGAACPGPLRKFISRCIARNPADRPTFPEILQGLEELEDDLVGTTGDM